MRSIVLCLIGWVGLSAAAQEARKPNIILIHADDLGWGDLSCYGQKKFKTPHLDRMAAEGMRFTQYYSGSTVCAPSRCALITGFHMGHAWVRGNGDIPLRPEDATVGEVLKAAGYATAAIGKWGLGQADTTGLPSKKGFDEHFGFLNHQHPHRQYTDHLWRNGEKVPIDPSRYANDLLTDAALDYIRSHKGGPFFLYFAPSTPHAEMRVPEDSLEPFKGKFPEKTFTSASADAHPSRGYRSQPTPNAATAAMIARLDRDVGRVLSLLKEVGVDQDTVVFFTSDNGPHKEGGRDPGFFQSSGPFKGIKRDLYEGGIRVPMIARWPGRIREGTVSEQVWAHWDFLPTAAEIGGANAPPVDGISMSNALLAKPQKDHDFLYWEFHERGFDQAVRMGDWKAVRHGPEDPIELYNLKADPAEATNVAGEHPEVVAKIDAYLKRARTDSERWPIKRKKGK